MDTRPDSPLPGLFKSRSVNLLIGSATSGKTTLMLSELERYVSSGEMFGIRLSGPAKQAGMIASSGNLDGTIDKILNMRLENLRNPIMFPVNEWSPGESEEPLHTFERIYREMCTCAQKPVHFIYVEAIQMMMDSSSKINDPKAVTQFFTSLNQFCLEHDLTIIGAVGQAKMRQGERYPLLADRIYGSIMWGQMSKTLIGIEQIMLHIPEERRPSARKVTIQAMDSRPRVMYYDFDGESRLNPVIYDEPDEEASAFGRLDAVLNNMQAGQEASKEEFSGWGEELGISLRTVERWISSRTSDDLGMLERVGSTRKRTFRKPTVN